MEHQIILESDVDGVQPFSAELRRVIPAAL